MSKIALIVGAGSGLSGSVARALADDGYRVVLAARNIDKLQSLCNETGAHPIQCDARSVDSVAALFKSMQDDVGTAEVVLYNNRDIHFFVAGRDTRWRVVLVARECARGARTIEKH